MAICFAVMRMEHDGQVRPEEGGKNMPKGNRRTRFQKVGTDGDRNGKVSAAVLFGKKFEMQPQN